MSVSRVVILGGGFAGMRCAKELSRRRHRDTVEVVLFNRENHMVFHPLLAEVAGGSVNPEAVGGALRQMLPRVRCRTEDVTRVDLDAGLLVYEGFDGRSRELSFEHLVIACGSVVNLGLLPGMADHAFPLKTIGDAIALRAHVMQQLEKAEVCDDPALRRFLLSFVVVGGGFSGVETAGEINDLARGSLRWYQNIQREDVQVTIVHSRSELLPEIGSELRDFTRRKMEKRGIRVLLDRRVGVVTRDGVELKDSELVRGATVVCTIGNAPSPIVEALEVEKEGGRLVTESDMRLPGRPNVWALGDCARVTNAHDGNPSPPTGQFADRQGRQGARNILLSLAGEPTRPFSFKPLGQLCAIGGHAAVAEVCGVKLSGFPAWCLWRSVYLMKLPGFSRKLKVGFDWAWELVFHRDLSHLKADTTDRVSRAYFKPGDFVFREGEPASAFYSIESGEVEIVREAGTDGRVSEEVLNVLRAGDFFGEVALVQKEPRNASVRAKTPVEVVVMGKEVFSQISGSLTAVRDLVHKAIRERARL